MQTLHFFPFSQTSIHTQFLNNGCPLLPFFLLVLKLMVEVWPLAMVVLRLSVFALLFVATALGSRLVEKIPQVNEESNLENKEEQYYWHQFVVTHRRLIGPGSSPPTCRERCGRCIPCMPVHVAINPVLATPLEYYPEAWRCKCGNKLYMP